MINSSPPSNKCSQLSPQKMSFWSPKKSVESAAKDSNLSPVQLGQTSPKIQHKPHSLTFHFSPPHIANRFGPLLRPNNSTSSSSSSLLGPLFPPGFEQDITPIRKQAHEKKRARRLLKKGRSLKINQKSSFFPLHLTNHKIPPSTNHFILLQMKQCS